MLFKSLILTSLLFSLSCSKKNHVDEKFTEEEWKTITAHHTPVSPQGENAIPFHEYSSGVNRLNSKVFIFEKLRFFAIEFETSEQAKKEAIRLNQYYAKNYLFDQVEGEPILEDFVIETFKAINPNRKIQKTKSSHSAKKHEEAAHH